jgi:hypothetical protein
MSIPVWPNQIQGLAWTVLKSMEGGKNIVQSSPAKNEVRIAQTYNPVWTFTLMYEWIMDAFQGAGNTMAYAPYTDIEYLMGFVMAAQGQFGDILLDDPSDDTVGPAMTAASPPEPNPQAELLLVNDGGSPPIYYSPIQRNMGGLFYEDITDLNGAISVYADGIEKTEGTDYTIIGPGISIAPATPPGYSWMGLVIQWASEPTPPISAAFQFYFRVRLNTDTVDFEQFMQELWTIGGENARNGTGTLKLTSSRPVAA